MAGPQTTGKTTPAAKGALRIVSRKVRDGCVMLAFGAALGYSLVVLAECYLGAPGALNAWLRGEAVYLEKRRLEAPPVKAGEKLTVPFTVHNISGSGAQHQWVGGHHSWGRVRL